MHRIDPRDHLMEVSKRPFLPAGPRLVWFRQDHPDATIETEMVEHNAGGGSGQRYALFRARITLRDNTVSTGWALESEFAAYVEKAETSAIARALDHMGYGTDAALAYRPELSSHLVDQETGEVLTPAQRSRAVEGEEQLAATTVQVLALKELSKVAVMKKLVTYDDIQRMLATDYGVKELKQLTGAQAQDLADTLLQL